MRTLAALAICCALPAQALELSLPNALVARVDTDPAGSVRVPVRPWAQGQVPKTAEGAIQRQVLRVPNSALTTLQLIGGLRATLEADGYTELFTCADAACGGFDFRFQLDLLGEPDMFVDLGDYRYLVMENPEAEPHLVALVASRSATAGFVHITTVSAHDLPSPGPAAEPVPEEAEAVPQPAPAEPAPQPVQAAPSTDLIAALTADAHAVLADLDFGTGSSNLGPGPYPSLDTLAAWLGENPTARIILVGHSDSVGSLEANTALSLRRAKSVADYLVSQLNANAAQIQAAGAGFLAPVASNLTPEGRAANRRVEVVLLSLE